MLFDEQIEAGYNDYPWTQDFIDAIWAGFWTPNEFDFKSDYNQFKKEMTEEEKQMIVRTITAIGQVEIAVKRFWAGLGDRFPHPSMYDVGFVMANSEVVHNQAYTKLLEKLSLKKAFKENLQEPVLKGRVDYLRKYLSRTYTDDKKQQIYSLILFTLFTENVSLFSQFYVILYMRRFKNFLKDTAQQVNYTRVEESLHSQLGIKLINTLKQEYPELFDQELNDKIIEEVNSAIEAEDKIIDWIVGGFSEEYLNPEVLKNFIRNRINESLLQIGIEYQVPVDEKILEKTTWVNEDILGNTRTDFFNTKSIEYSKNSQVFDPEDII